MILARHRRNDYAFALGKHGRGGSGIGIAGAQTAWPVRFGSVAFQQTLRVRRCHPSAFLSDADGNDSVLLLVDCLEHRSRRKQRDFMLAASPAKQHTNSEFLHEWILN